MTRHGLSICLECESNVNILSSVLSVLCRVLCIFSSMNDSRVFSFDLGEFTADILLVEDSKLNQKMIGIGSCWG